MAKCFDLAEVAKLAQTSSFYKLNIHFLWLPEVLCPYPFILPAFLSHCLAYPVVEHCGNIGRELVAHLSLATVIRLRHRIHENARVAAILDCTRQRRLGQNNGNCKQLHSEKIWQQAIVEKELQFNYFSKKIGKHKPPEARQFYAK